jgi:hypothetical protein
MKRFFKVVPCGTLLLFLAHGAYAQQMNSLCVPLTTGGCQAVTATNPLPTTGGGGGGGGAITAASGAYAAGALSAGSGVDGWDLTQGTKADTAWAGSGAGSVVAVLKGIYNVVAAPLPGAVTSAAPSYTTGTTNSLSLNTTGDLRVISKVSDGTNTAAVKAASTAAATTDPGVVVNLSPNGLMFGTTAAATAPTYGMSVLGYYTTSPPTLTTGQSYPLRVSAAGLLQTTTQIAGNAGATLDVAQGGATAATNALQVAGVYNSTPPTLTTGQGAAQQISVTGRVAVSLAPVSASNLSAFTAPNTGAGTTFAPIVLGGYNSTPYALTTGQSAPAAMNTAAMQLVDTENLKATYSISGTFTPAATPTDVVVLPGSASKTIRIKRVRVQGRATVVGDMTLALIKRSTANSAGTSTNPTVVPSDSNNAAGSAVPLQYSVNPTPGTAVGTLDTYNLAFPLAGTTNPGYDRTFSTNNDQAIVLRGVAQSLAINFGGGTVPTTGVLFYMIEYTEE